MANHSSTHAWRITRPEESGGLQSMGSQESVTTTTTTTTTSQYKIKSSRFCLNKLKKKLFLKNVMVYNDYTDKMYEKQW